MTSQASPEVPSITLTMTWDVDFNVDGSVTELRTGEIIVPALGEWIESEDLHLEADHQRILRYVAGVPGQCRPVLGATFRDLEDRGLIILARPNQWNGADRYDLTPAGESVMLVIGERAAR